MKIENRRVIVLGAGEKRYPEEWTTVDWKGDADIIFDLEQLYWYELPKDYYDLVVAEHVAEHMTDRIQFLRNATELLKLGGEMIVEVPSFKNERAYFTLEHKTYWGRGIFDDGLYVDLRLERVEFLPYRLTGFFGRLLDRLGFVSDYRFYLRRIK